MSSNRFKKRVNDFKSNGYESLISRKFMNQNRRKVTYKIEDLVRGLAAQAEHPYDTVVAEMYNQFVTGNCEAYDPERVKSSTLKTSLTKAGIRWF